MRNGGHRTGESLLRPGDIVTTGWGGAWLVMSDTFVGDWCGELTHIVVMFSSGEFFSHRGTVDYWTGNHWRVVRSA